MIRHRFYAVCASLFLAPLLGLTSAARAQDTASEEARLQAAAKEALVQLQAVCADAWRFDNLRPTILRAVAPVGNAFQRPEAPIVFLSPGTPAYRYYVGQMTYWFSLYQSRMQRADEERKTTAPPLGELSPQARAAYGELTNDMRHATDMADLLKARYWRICAQAWPYVNLKPLCKLPGIEAATILNPFLPVPTIALGDQAEVQRITAAFGNLETQRRLLTARLNDYRADREALLVAAKAAAPTTDAAADPRLPEMARTLDQLRPALKEWRELERKIEALSQPWETAKINIERLIDWGLAIEADIADAIAAQNSKDPAVRNAGQTKELALQAQLNAVRAELARVRQEVAQIEAEVTRLKREQASVAQGGISLDDWAALCDVFGRLGVTAHQQALSHLEQQLAADPQFWHPYLARGIARLHTGKQAEALEDLRRVEEKMQLYGADSGTVALVRAIRAYALCKQKDTREGDRLFGTLLKEEPKSRGIYLIRGWSNLERHKYTFARNDLRAALPSTDRNPRAEALEAMALLLAASPDAKLRNGKQAVEQATKAHDLAGGKQEWIYLSTLAAACAEAGDFQAALKWTAQALASAPEACKSLVAERAALYEAKQPFRLK